MLKNYFIVIKLIEMKSCSSLHENLNLKFELRYYDGIFLKGYRDGLQPRIRKFKLVSVGFSGDVIFFILFLISESASVT